jgi:hypothetical protein
MRGRIRNLENLVVTLINQKAQEQEGSTAGPNFASQSGPHISGEPKKPANEEPHIDSFGQLRISTAGSENYVGAGHWSNILKEIEEVKASLEEDDWTQEVQEEEWDHFSNSTRWPLHRNIGLHCHRRTLISHIWCPEARIEGYAHPGLA